MAGIGKSVATRIFSSLLTSTTSVPKEAEARVTRVDEDGVPWVAVAGSDEETPANGSVTSEAQVGQTVRVSVQGGKLSIVGNSTSPSVGGEYVRGVVAPVEELAEETSIAVRATSAVANAANTVAQAAQAIAQATNQHFWHRATDPDEDGAGTGAFVTDEAQETFLQAIADGTEPTAQRPLHNLLMNSEGILLRAAKYVRAAFTQSAVAFYDGLGNAATNITARFGADGSQIGKSGESHVELNYHSMRMVDKEENTYFHVSDLRDEEGLARLTEVTRNVQGDRDTGEFWVTLNEFPASLEDTSSIESVTANGPRVVSYELVSDVTGSELRMILEPDEIWVSEPAMGLLSTSSSSEQEEEEEETGEGEWPDEVDITVVYWTESQRAKAFTFGVRNSSSSIGTMSVAMGRSLVASGRCSHAEGDGTAASGESSHAEGDSTTASSYYAHAEGYNTTASGSCSHAEGHAAEASTYAAHAEGHNTTASGDSSHAEGYNTTASGESSHAEGVSTTASAYAAHAEGCISTASGAYAHAEGRDTTASSFYAHAEGYNTKAGGNYSHAQNNGTIAAGSAQTALGKYNVSDTTSAVIIGNGSDDSNRSNALTVDWSGNIWAAGKATLLGAMEAASAAITGALSAASATITGTLTADDLATSSDVPWTLLTLDSACHAYNDATANAPRYRRWGQLVTVTGIIAPTAEVAAGGTLAIATLPAGVRPHQQVNLKCQGSNRAHWCLNITAAGVMTANRYGDENGAQAMGTNIWMPFTVTYLV